MARGFTIIEVAVLLSVVSLVGALVVGTAGDLLNEAKLVQAREEVEQVGQAIARFYGDNGFFPKTADVINGRPGSVALGVLISDAPFPASTDASRPWVDSEADSMTAHLSYNQLGYAAGITGTTHGWRGPYLSRVLDSDRWGHAYLVNVFYLDAELAVRDTDSAPRGAAFVLSSGPNRTVETPYFQPREEARLYGDDIGYRLR